MMNKPTINKPTIRKPLQGVRITDFTVHAAGPFCTHMLALLGAECIKVESTKRMDVFRKPHPVYGRMEAASFAQVAANKLSIQINMKHARGAELARRVIAISDIMCESFRPGVMEILKRQPAPVVPLALCGLWGSFFSRKGGAAMSKPFRRGSFARVELKVAPEWAPQTVTPEGLQAATLRMRGDWK